MTDPTHSLPLMLEAVDELVDLLEAQKKLLAQGRQPPEELLERLRLASAGVGEMAERLRSQPPPAPGPEARALKERLEQRFVLAFRLTRENEQAMRGAAKGADLGPGTCPPTGRGDPPAARGSRSQIERLYRERMRGGNRPPGPEKEEG